MLTLRLEPDAFIPNFATHYIGAGGVVLNEARELLVICEKAHSHNRPHYYKLPGGALIAPGTPGGRRYPRGVGGDRDTDQFPIFDVFPALAWLPIWQVGYLFYLPFKSPDL